MQIADSALVAAATLSNRYIPSRQLPDKAIDLIDEAASRLRMELTPHRRKLTSCAAPWTASPSEELAPCRRDRSRIG